MRTSTATGGWWTLTATENGEWVTMGVTTADPNWRATDALGHEHHYDHGYPTLDRIVDAEHWCNGNEGTAPHDPHQQIDELHYECLICREVIEPGTLPPEHQTYMPGMVSLTITGTRSDGMKIEASATPEEADAIRSATEAERDATVLAVLDGIPDDRIHSYSWSASTIHRSL